MHRTLALAALLALPPVVAAQTTVPLEVADGGYLYVHARVADGIDARLLLDTGAGINTISESILTHRLALVSQNSVTQWSTTELDPPEAMRGHSSYTTARA